MNFIPLAQIKPHEMPEFNGSLRSKLPKSGTTIFTVMSQLAAEEKAINLSQGFPDFECDPELVSLINQYMKKGYNQYAPMAGHMPLRESIARKTEELYGAIYHPETEITVTAGGTQAIFTAIAATINEGDEVIIFTPAYDCYEPAIELNGGKAIYIQLTLPDYSIDWDQVKKVINQKTKMIIINTPHNPTGSVLGEGDMMMMEKLIGNTDILVLSDEVYEHILFDGTRHESVCRYPGLAQRSFIVSSFGKTYSATGWKIGYCLAPEALMKEFRKAHQYIVFAVNTPIQCALAEYLEKKEAYLELSAFYQEKRDYFNRLVNGSRLEALPTRGTYFQLFGYGNITDEADTDFAVRLTKEHKLATIPVSVFYHRKVDEKVLRVCFAKENSTLEQAAEVINNI